ncbi:MAG: SusC/RagA family TonB-linked outer membrane protein [Niabella sp.]|nr:SusC/RagA family TonB-linked outer membrane protein [Niabella sp.]
MSINNCLGHLRNLCLLLLLAGTVSDVNAQVSDSTKSDTASKAIRNSRIQKGIDPVIVRHLTQQPYISLQQMIKGNAAGLYVQEPNGEPGTEQFMYIRGLQTPLLSKKDLYAQQPAVYLDGIPMMPDNNMVFDIQPTDFNRIGPATNLLSVVEADNIESIKVLKDPAELAKLGPLAANGAIWITSKVPRPKRNDIFVNTYFGAAFNAPVTPVNAAYENSWRQPFYDKYGTLTNRLNIPTYLKDSTDASYYGPANWTDAYYKTTPVYSINAGAAVGNNPRANVRFSLNHTNSASGQDGSKFHRYGFSIVSDLKPFPWMTFTSLVTGSRLERDRDKNVRDRLAEVRYTPSLLSPLPPNKQYYQKYLNVFTAPGTGAIDNNIVNDIKALAAVNMSPIKQIKIVSQLSIAYNENIRDAFWPTFLLSGNNFTSNYFGFNQRIQLDNSISYPRRLNKDMNLEVEAGQSFRSDVQRYDYAYGYNTPSDYIKVRALKNDPDNGYPVYNFQYHYLATDKQKIAQSSLYGRLHYTYKDFLEAEALIRRDGASFIQPNLRWITEPMGNIKWDVEKSGLIKSAVLSSFVVRASYGVLGIPYNTDLYSQGPVYVTTGLTWPQDPTIPSFLGSGVAAHPYTQGWIGYGIDWQKAYKANLGVDLGFLKERLMITLDVYNNDNKNMLILLPAARELGYSGVYKNGMAINNKGLDATISFRAVQSKAVNWTSALNFNFNKNTLTALPDGLQSVIIGNRMLKVGAPADAFWVFENQGIYNSLSDIPTTSSGRRQTFYGGPLNPGDPKWRDVNGDGDINDKDKVLKGNALPKLNGGFSNDFSYKRYALNFMFHFAIGQKLLNQEISNRLNFVNNEGNADLNTVKEITYWQKDFTITDYPMYNPWSNVIPYQSGQDLFLQNASYVKLRSVSLSYDVLGKRKMGGISKFLVYVSGTNLFTISPFKNGDPELVNYLGNYTGYSQKIPKMAIVGARLSF